MFIIPIMVLMAGMSACDSDDGETPELRHLPNGARGFIAVKFRHLHIKKQKGKIPGFQLCQCFLEEAENVSACNHTHIFKEAAEFIEAYKID